MVSHIEVRKLLEGAFWRGVPPFWVKNQTRMVRIVVNCSKAITMASHHYIMKTSYQSYRKLIDWKSYSMSKLRETPPSVMSTVLPELVGSGIESDTSDSEMVPEESEMPMMTMKPRMSSSLMMMFQIGWKISAQFSAMTCAASLMQLIASLMCLQLISTISSYSTVKPNTI